MSKPNMTREVRPRERARLRQACRALKQLVDAGWFLYLDESGNMHLMRGPSHDEHHRQQQHLIVDSENCGAGGGAW